MCTNSSKWSLRRQQLKQRKLRVLSLSRKRRTRRASKEEEDKETKRWLVGAKDELEMKNLRLYMENRSIMEANERLRQRALFLHRENKALLFQLSALSAPEQVQSPNQLKPNSPNLNTTQKSNESTASVIKGSTFMNSKLK